MPATLLTNVVTEFGRVLIFLYVKHKLWLIKALLMSCRQLLIIWRLYLKFLFLNIAIMKRKARTPKVYRVYINEVNSVGLILLRAPAPQ